MTRKYPEKGAYFPCIFFRKKWPKPRPGMVCFVKTYREYKQKIERQSPWVFGGHNLWYYPQKRVLDLAHQNRTTTRPSFFKTPKKPSKTRKRCLFSLYLFLIFEVFGGVQNHCFLSFWVFATFLKNMKNHTFHKKPHKLYFY